MKTFKNVVKHTKGHKTAKFKLFHFYIVVGKNMTEIKSDNINAFLSKLGFNLLSGEEATYSKKYKEHENYEIRVKLNSEFKKSSIDYGDKIRRDRDTTSNFSQQENFVVLECLNRLLEKGYAPDKLVLEKKFPLGHEYKGYLDIQILDSNDKSFLMIECKTWGREYKKEKNAMYDNGGLLFSYFNQDKNTNYLCLYASTFDGTQFIFENSIIKITSEIKNGTTTTDCFEKWRPQIFEDRGLFETESSPYNIKFIGLMKKDLKPLTKEDGGDIFNRFAEILRRNVVSDKTNAYNKIFNLFLCKIVDEYERDEKEKVKFQWEDSESNEEVLLKLNGLYKQGMKEYLDLKISAIDIEEIEEQLKNVKTEEDRQRIKQFFIQQKLYTSNDFAFKEVFDKNTFDLNCIVVKEAVKLLEKYKIKYETKQQFLGDFFESLLNTGIKQEVGQFFTPVPIAQFICKSLPIWNIIKEKNNNQEIYFLPFCIDYASGAGHFLTEVMDEINYYIENKIGKDFIKNGRARMEYEHYKDNFKFAEKYIYGIENDYRLAKTTKIATFLNGDGEAVVICGNGLDSFYYSKDYKQKLKLAEKKKDNEVFDIVVANPPYSVSGFKTALNYGKESFDLFDEFTDKSKEIECLFVERAKQLLREGGVAGIVLPPTILEGEKAYTKTRELILDNFEIKGIVKLGKDTFMATDTATIILFLKRVKDRKADIIYYINKGLSEKKEIVINRIEKPFSSYLETTYKISFNEYLNFFQNDDTEDKDLKKIRGYASYITEFKKQDKIINLKDFVKEKELNKLLYFILTFNKKVVFYNVPLSSAKEHKKVLGYEFSKRRGYEGIHILKLGGQLYTPENLYDDKKVNTYILKNFENEDIEIKEEIPHLSILYLHNMIDFSDTNCAKVININKYETRKNKTSERANIALLKVREEKVREKVLELIEKYPKSEIKKVPLKEVLLNKIETGGTPHTRTNEFWENGTINWLKISDMKGRYIYETEKKITEEGRKDKNLTIFNEGTLLFSIFGTIGKIGILKIKTTLNQAICALIPNEEVIIPEYLYYILLAEKDKIEKDSRYRTQGNFNQTKLGNWEISLIEDTNKQKDFVKKITEFEKDVKL